jgi:ABC-type glycerol-3-phosphate transport system permease component
VAGEDAALGRAVRRRPASTRAWSPARARRVAGRALLYALLIGLSLLFLVPLAWMISTSLKPSDEVTIFPVRWIPGRIRWQNYVEAWGLFPFTRFVLNSLYVVVLSTVGTLLSCSLVAYGFARIRFRGRNFFFFVMLMTMMLPSAVTMIPVYVLFARLHWVDSFRPLIVPSFFGSAFNIFFLRQFMMTLPRDLDEAARIDGAGHLTTFLRVILPLVRPAVVAVAVLHVFATWNDFFGPLLYLNTPENFTFVLGLRALQTDVVYGGRYEWLMALSLIQLAPMLVLYFLAQRYFVEGLSLTGVRG